MKTKGTRHILDHYILQAIAEVEVGPNDITNPRTGRRLEREGTWVDEYCKRELQYFQKNEEGKPYETYTPQGAVVEYHRMKDEGLLGEPLEATGITIYGLGGWNRYYVLNNGNVVFNESKSYPAAIKRASDAGFGLW